MALLNIVPGAHKGIPPIRVIGQQEIMPLPSTTTGITPKRTNKKEISRKNYNIKLN